MVDLPGPGAAAMVQPVPTGRFRRVSPHLDQLPGEDATDRLARALPASGHRDHLVGVSATGRLALTERAALQTGVQALAPDCGGFRADLSALRVEARPGDLDLIDPAGALRHAAEALLADSHDPQRSPSDRDIAAAALSRLYSLAQEVRA